MPDIRTFWNSVERGLPVAGEPWLEALSRAALAEAAFDIPAARMALDASTPADAAWQAVRELLDVRVTLREGQALAYGELGRRLATLRALDLEEATRARAWHTSGVLHIRRDEPESAQAALLEALRLIDDSPSRLWILDSLGQVYQAEGAWVEARRVLRAVAAQKEAAGDQLGTAISVGNLALLEIGLGNKAGAESLLLEVLERLGPKLPMLSVLRLRTLLVQAVLGTGRELVHSMALEAALQDAGEGSHHLKGFARLALARARPDEAAQWLEHAERDFSSPSDLALVNYWRMRLLPRGGDEARQVAQTRALIKRAGGASEAELLTLLLFAERARDANERQQQLEAAFEYARKANNPLWVARVDRMYERLDPRGFSRRVSERFSGRSAEELEKTALEDATSIFADLVGFTSRSQELSPEETMETVRSLFELAVPLFVRFKVRPLQYQGDGLLAVCQGEGHASRGLGFARALVAKTLRVTEVRKALGDKWGLTVRAGVASGPTVLGVLGSHYKLEFQAIGRTVNLASRLQGQAEPGQVCAAWATVEAAGIDVSILKAEQAPLKGFNAPERFARLAPSARDFD
jgi:class 3 adenylate cyclase